MNFASEVLMEEHEGILFGLKILEKMVGAIEAETVVVIPDIQELVIFLRLFADKCHHGKEEGLLFPAMEKAGIPKEGGPIGQMLREHEEGRGYLERMSEALESGVFGTDAFIRSSTGYIALLRSHVEKENTILFPMGDRMIPVEQQACILEAFKKHENEVMGIGTHEKLHEMLHAFELTYLGKE